MRMCLTCHRICPTGSAFCGYCGRTFVGRVCPRGHMSPPGVSFCVICGRPDMTDHTPSLNLWLLPKVIAGSMVVGVSYLVWHLAASAAEAIGREILNVSVVVFVFVFVLLNFVPGKLPGMVQDVTASTARIAFRVVCRAAVMLWRLIIRMVNG